MAQLSSSTCVGTAISDSAGWQNFLANMPVSVGDILAFEVVDTRHLVASIAYHRGRAPGVTATVPDVVNVHAPHFRAPEVAVAVPLMVNVDAPHFRAPVTVPQVVNPDARHFPAPEVAVTLPQVLNVDAPHFLAREVAVTVPQVVNVNAPHFRKKLRFSHTRPHKSARLVTPPFLTVLNTMLGSIATLV